MLLSPENVEKVTLASCILRNFLRMRIPTAYTAPGTIGVENIDDGTIQEGVLKLMMEEYDLLDLWVVTIKKVRDDFCAYFNAIGTVPRQDKFI